jgi:hypothetical protein
VGARALFAALQTRATNGRKTAVSFVLPLLTPLTECMGKLFRREISNALFYNG